jgi:hypothetical protein
MYLQNLGEEKYFFCWHLEVTEEILAWKFNVVAAKY